MGLRDIGASLPPGFKFYPSDEELVCHYLYKKITNEKVLKGTLVEIDLHKCEPWELPEVAKLNSNEWYFFSFRDRKYATGFRTNRATTTGYWKATGKDRTVHHPKTRAVVGMRKTLVFYRNRAPNGIKTGWIMHEFRLENPNMPPKEDWVLCRVFHKSKQVENGDKLSPQRLSESAATPVATTSYFAAASPTDQTFPHHSTITSFSPSPPHNPSSGLQDFADAINPNFLQLSQEIENIVPATVEIINSKCNEDEYGFLFDMNFEEGSLADGMPSNLGEMRFEDDTGLVFF